MGSAGLIEIKRRIKSAEGTRKIIKTMNPIVTSKLRKARKGPNNNEEHYKLCEEILVGSMSALPEDYESSFFKKASKDLDKLYIVIASDMDLYEDFNGNIASSMNEVIRGKGPARIVVTGSEGISYTRKYGFDAVREYVEIPDMPTIEEVRSVYDDALCMFKTGEIGEVSIVFTEFRSPIKQEVKMERLLPMGIENEKPKQLLTEPSLEEVLSSSLDVYSRSKLRRTMLYSKINERDARMTAMDGAAQNANDILQSLNLEYNRIGRGMIT